MKKKRIALLLLGVASRNCGGAERFFSDLFYQYRDSEAAGHALYFFADTPTLDTLTDIGKLKRGEGVFELRNVSNRFKRSIENLNLLRHILFRRIDIVHVTNYGRNYYDRLAFLRRLPAFLRPKIAINIVDCEIPYILGDASSVRHEGYKLRYMPLFREIQPDGYFSWYRLFCEYLRKENLAPSGTILESATSRFADTSGFIPAAQKKQIVVFAARMTGQKQPMMFAEAVSYLLQQHAGLVRGWQFRMYGNGPEEERVRRFILEHDSGEQLTLHPTTDLRPVFAESKCFVSTQDYENFPSLSMNEAMAAGNAIIARNVGQTAYFVKDGENGFLSREDSAEGIARAILDYITKPELHAGMQAQSCRLANEVHTPENFIRQIDAFWEKLQA